jgi:hypothetical protein
MKETTYLFDDVDFTNGDNTNGIVRMAYIKESKVLDLQGPILHDLFQVKRYILSQVGIMTSGLTCTLHTLKALSSISILYFFASLLNRQKSGLDR